MTQFPFPAIRVYQRDNSAEAAASKMRLTPGSSTPKTLKSGQVVTCTPN